MASLQPGVLIFERPQPFGFRDIHAAKAGLPFVDAGVTDPVLAAKVSHADPGRVLLQYPDNLLFTETAALHALVLMLGQNELQTGLGRRGKVTGNIGCCWASVLNW